MVCVQAESFLRYHDDREQLLSSGGLHMTPGSTERLKDSTIFESNPLPIHLFLVVAVL
jgi:hypothetical protein